MSLPDLASLTCSAPPDYYRLVLPRSLHESGLWLLPLLNDNSNRRQLWYVRHADIRRWRTHGFKAAQGLVSTPIVRARVVGELRFADRRRRDPSNWTPTAKAAVDGLVDAGVFIDDSSRFVVGPDMREGPTVARRQDEAPIIHIWRQG